MPVSGCGSRRIVPGFAAGLLLVVATGLHAAQPSIAGVLKDVAGMPLTGAVVKVTNEKLGLSFMIVTRDQGRYRTPDLPAGVYTIQGFAPGFQSELSGPVDIDGSQLRQIDIALKAPLKVPGPGKRMTDPEIAKLMPDADGKSAVVNRCTTCHTLQWIASARKSPEKWKETVNRMRDNLQGADRPLNNISGESDWVQQDAITEYLSKNFTPATPIDPRISDQGLPGTSGMSHPNRNLPGALLPVPAIAMEFSLPQLPADIAVGLDGIVWVAESEGGMLGRFDPRTLAYARIALPSMGNHPAHLSALAVDTQGSVWLADDGPNARLLRYNPVDQQFKSYKLPEYRFPLPPGRTPSSVVTLRFLDGNVWATGVAANWIVKVDTRTGEAAEYPIPKGSSPYGLAIGGDRQVWYSAEVGNLIGRLNPANGLLKHYDVPTARSEVRGMAADGEGNLWVAATASGKLYKINSQNGAFTEFAPPTLDGGPYSLDVDAKGGFVWFNEVYADKIARFDPHTTSFLEFPAPSADLDITKIEIDRVNRSRVWWAAMRAGKIGYIEVVE